MRWEGGGGGAELVVMHDCSRKKYGHRPSHPYVCNARAEYVGCVTDQAGIARTKIVQWRREVLS